MAPLDTLSPQETRTKLPLDKHDINEFSEKLNNGGEEEGENFLKMVYTNYN